MHVMLHLSDALVEFGVCGSIFCHNFQLPVCLTGNVQISQRNMSVLPQACPAAPFSTRRPQCSWKPAAAPRRADSRPEFSESFSESLNMFERPLIYNITSSFVQPKLVFRIFCNVFIYGTTSPSMAVGHEHVPQMASRFIELLFEPRVSRSALSAIAASG